MESRPKTRYVRRHVICGIGCRTYVPRVRAAIQEAIESHVAGSEDFYEEVIYEKMQSSLARSNALSSGQSLKMTCIEWWIDASVKPQDFAPISKESKYVNIVLEMIVDKTRLKSKFIHAQMQFALVNKPADG
jgi:hypothetical protein